MPEPTRTRLLVHAGDGSPRQVAQTTHWRHVTNVNNLGVRESMPIEVEYHLENGTRLDYVDQNTFKNQATGELLYRIPPGIRKA